MAWASDPLPGPWGQLPESQEPTPTPPWSGTAGTTGCAAMPVHQVLRRYETTLHGLEETQAQVRLAHHGDNVLPMAASPYPVVRLLTTTTNPFVLVLLGLTVVSALTSDLDGAAVIGLMALISCVLQFRQERRSDRAAAALRALVTTTAGVLRRAAPMSPPLVREVPMDQLVPGDIVSLTAGDMIPADLLVLRSQGLAVDQAVLSGESSPVDKHAGESGDGLFDDPRLCFMGATVVSGTGTAVVVATGQDTRLSKAAEEPAARRAETAFDRGVTGVSMTLICFMLVCVPLVLAARGLTHGLGIQTWLFAVSVAVGLTPEMLSVVVTTAMTRGAQALARRGVIVKRLPALHNLGAMDVLCTDKTGTLTDDQTTTVDRAFDPQGRPNAEVLRWARLNSHWSSQAGEIPDVLDEALLARSASCSAEVAHVDGFVALGVVPFDAHRRRATVVLRPADQIGTAILVTKGAIDEVLACCTRIRGHGLDGHTEDTPFTSDGRIRLTDLTNALSADGIRLLAVAVADRHVTGRPYRVADESDLTLVGFVGFRDQARESVPAALSSLAARRVAVKVLTGDHPLVAARTCQDAGITTGPILLGADVDGLGDSELARLADRTTVFARLDPQQKTRIVRALRAGGHTVGFVGDGVNDVPALRAADVGICVGSAIEAARAGTDVVLPDRDLHALAEGITEGRRIFGNVIKYLKITVSSNVGNVGSMLAASLMLPFLPMLPLLILVQNLCFDMSQLTLAFDHVEERQLWRPRTFDIGDIVRFVFCLGLVNMLADLATFAILWRITGSHPGPERQALFQTGWFAENLLTQAIAVILLRRRDAPSLRNRPSGPVLIGMLRSA